MIEEEKNLNRLRIGQRISELRQEKGLSLKELADMVGIDFSNLSKIERGKYTVGIDILYKVCKALVVELKIE